jgi:uncharacterized SAM-binding protein YcdF (DUF218 family)
MVGSDMTYTQPLLLVFSLATLFGLARVWRCKQKALLLAGTVRLIFNLLAARRVASVQTVGGAISGSAVLPDTRAAAAVSPPLYERPYPQARYDTIERCAYATWVYRQIGPVPVLACGGGKSNNSSAFAVTMRELLRQAGVPENMIWTEEASTSTYENARFGAEILRRHGIGSVVLVVDARSMPRAVVVLEKQGIRVTTAPARFRGWDGLRELLPSWEAIRGNEDTLHETLGLFWYKLRGWI